MIEISDRDRLGNLIDCNWIYSANWPSYHDDFVKQAEIDLGIEIAIAKKRIKELEGARILLVRIKGQ